MSKHILASTLLFIAACKDLGQPVAPSLPVNQLLAVAERIVIQGREFYLTSSLNRDFMPMTPPEGSPLSGLCYLIAADSLLLPSLSMDVVWIVYNGEAWSSFFFRDYSQTYPYIQAKVFVNGPKWGPGVKVDVIVRISDAAGNLYLLRASNQEIGATS